MRTRFAVCALLLLGGCAVKQSRLVAPYQRALGAYYRAIETDEPGDLDTAEREATAVLTRDPGDHTARILRANILLTRYRKAPDAGLRRRFLTDLKTLSASIGSPADSLDWVPVRALVSMGDLLLLEGNAQGKTPLARTLYEAARHFYGGAAGIADKKTSPTPGLTREAANARNGHLAALRGAIEVVNALDPDLAKPLTKAVRQEAVDAWEAQSKTGAVTVSAAPVLSFDPVEHGSMKALNLTLGNIGLGQMKTWCSVNGALLSRDPASLSATEKTTLGEGGTQHRRLLALADLEAVHGALETLLRHDNPDSSMTSKVEFFLSGDLKSLCSGLSQ